MSCIAVVISFFLALVVCRITGEANITPTGAMGKVTQLIFGGIAPGHVTANLMAANITSGASSSSADLLVDLKVGYLLGANPANNSSPSFPEFFWEPSSPCWPSAPWFRMRTLSRLSMLREPEHGRPQRKHWAWGSAICTASRCFPSLQAVFSDSFWCLFPAIFPGQENGPTPIGFGLAWAIQWNDSFFFFTGAVLGWAADHLFKAKSREYKVPTASGIIAGAALTEWPF